MLKIQWEIVRSKKKNQYNYRIYKKYKHTYIPSNWIFIWGTIPIPFIARYSYPSMYMVLLCHCWCYVAVLDRDRYVRLIHFSLAMVKPFGIEPRKKWKPAALSLWSGCCIHIYIYISLLIKYVSQRQQMSGLDSSSGVSAFGMSSKDEGSSPSQKLLFLAMT